MKSIRKMISIDEDLCNGCGQCVPGCAEGALQIVDGKARLVSETYCDGLGACLGECPTGALAVVEVEAEDFDPAAVKRHLRAEGREVPDHMPDPASLRIGQPAAPAGGCPSAAMMRFDSPCAKANVPAAQAGQGNLGHWPIQLRLVPPDAPFLRGSHLLLTADCSAAALPGFHAEWLPGKTLLLGCPKFDDVELYERRLTDILAQAGLAGVTILEMEVPCCSGMHRLLLSAARRAGVTLPVERVVVGRDGCVRGRETLM